MLPRRRPRGGGAETPGRRRSSPACSWGAAPGSPFCPRSPSSLFDGGRITFGVIAALAGARGRYHTTSCANADPPPQGEARRTHSTTVRRAQTMPTMDDYAKQPREQRMQRLARTADDLAAAIEGRTDTVLSRRPDAKNWAAKEVICHLRDTEEVFGERCQQIAAMHVEPRLIP